MKMLRVFSLVVILLIAFGCDDKNPTENDPDPGEVVLSDETVVLEETQVNENLQTVSPDGNTLTFTNTSATEDFEEGDILISGITDLMPNGFLKKVTNVQSNSSTITVTTENTSLDEALQQGGLSASYTFLPSRIENANFADGVQLISNSREDLFSLIIDKVFYDADGNPNTTDDQIKVVGTLDFTAEMLMNINISNWQLNEFDIQLVNTFERDLTFENSIAYNLQEELNIVELNFPIITFFIGIVPVTIHPTISIDAYVDASLQAGISFGVTATETMTTGTMYENNNWSPISSYEKTLEFNGPNGYGSIDVQAGLKPQLQTMIYSVIGPYIVLDAYGKFDCSVEVSFDDLLISEEISYGLDLDAGILIEILSHTIANFSMDIYDDEWILHQYEYTIGQAPVVTITSPSNGSQFDLGTTVNFAGNATDLQDGNLTGNDLEWISNVDGSLGYGENLSVSDLTQGPHSITLIATDSDDYTGEDDVSISISGTGSNYFFDNFNDGDFTNNPEWTVINNDDIPGSVVIIDSDYVKFFRNGAIGNGGGVYLENDLDIDVHNNTYVKFDVNPVFSDVFNGAGVNNNEYPINFYLYLLDSNGNELTLRFCYNYRGGESLYEDNYIRIAFSNCDQNIWLRNEQFNINEYFPQAVTIDRILVGGNGWNFEGYVDNIDIAE